MNLTMATYLAYQTRTRDDIESALEQLELYRKRNLISRETYTSVHQQMTGLLNKLDKKGDL